MSDYDAIVIGAGHNGLTAAAVMARGGLRVLCLEKNHFIGGMSSSTELIRDYHFELAGSIQFPLPNEIFEDLGFDSCPIYEPEVQSASIGPSGEPPILLYSDPERLLAHLGDALGLDAVMGMAEVAAWAEAPARAIGRFDVRKPPKSLDEMWACATNEFERQAIRTAMFGSVMDVVDQFLPDREKHAQVRSMLSFLSVNSTYLGPYTPGSALCLAFALASPGNATMSKVRGGIGAMADHVRTLFENNGGELRRHVKASKIVASGGRVEGVALADGEVVTAPVVVSNLDPTATFTQLMDRNELPDAFARRVEAIDHRAAYFQIHYALGGLPEFAGPYEILNEGGLRRNVTFFGTAEQMQVDYEGCVRGFVPQSPSFNLGIPTLEDPGLAPAGKHAASSFAFYFPIGSTRGEQAQLRDEMASRIVAKVTAMAPNFPDLIERQFNYPAYTYELMFGCTGGDFTHGLLQPEFMGPFRPGPRGWPDNPVPVDGLFLCGAGCHGGPGVTFIPGYNCGYAVLEAADSSRT
ncbi:MAG TPA: NAD(P)/FAD-dependent oxidoreductase [Acidimicrobiales bacterium]|nr:NAD(P)/FAD-dependent oxidoreductase [Acidimicrobiales bacterium]